MLRMPSASPTFKRLDEIFALISSTTFEEKENQAKQTGDEFVGFYSQPIV